MHWRCDWTITYMYEAGAGYSKALSLCVAIITESSICKHCEYGYRLLEYVWLLYHMWNIRLHTKKALATLSLLNLSLPYLIHKSSFFHNLSVSSIFRLHFKMSSTTSLKTMYHLASQLLDRCRNTFPSGRGSCFEERGRPNHCLEAANCWTVYLFLLFLEIESWRQNSDVPHRQEQIRREKREGRPVNSSITIGQRVVEIAAENIARLIAGSRSHGSPS